jgi:hypothetical protein
MANSENKVFPLNIEKSEEFITEKEKIQLDLELIDGEESSLKLKDMRRRKSSTVSTSVSKPEDTLEFSCPNTPLNIPKESQQKESFFGREKNCSNYIFNFYQASEEYLKETLPEYQNYKKTKNYLPKEEYLKKLENLSQNRKSNYSSKNSLENLCRNNNSFKSSLPTTPVAAIFTPNLCYGGKGKFDIPMYYAGFYSWDCKF